MYTAQIIELYSSFNQDEDAHVLCTIINSIDIFDAFEDNLNPQGGESLLGINLFSTFIRCLVFSSTTTLSSTAGFNFRPSVKGDIFGVGRLILCQLQMVDERFQRIPA